MPDPLNIESIMTPMRHTLLLTGSLLLCIAAGPGCSGANWWSRQTAAAPNAAEAEATRIRSEIERNIQEGGRYEASGDFASAKLSYQQVLSLDSRHTLARHRLGVLADREGRGAEAQEHYRAAYESDPRNTDLLSDIGYSFAMQGDFDAAERVLADSLHLDPQHGRSLANLRFVKQRRAEHAAALQGGAMPAEQTGPFAGSPNSPAIHAANPASFVSHHASPPTGQPAHSHVGGASPWSNSTGATANRSAPARQLSGPELQAHFAEIDRRGLPDGRPIDVDPRMHAAGPRILPTGGELKGAAETIPTSRSMSVLETNTAPGRPATDVSRPPGPVISPAIVPASAVDSERSREPRLNVTAAELGLRAGVGLPQFSLPMDAEPPASPASPSPASPSQAMRPNDNGGNPNGLPANRGLQPPPWNGRSPASNGPPPFNNGTGGNRPTHWGPNATASPAINPAVYEERQTQAQSSSANARRSLPADASSHRPNDPTQWMNAGSPFQGPRMPKPQAPDDWSQFLSSNAIDSPSIPSAQGRVFNGAGRPPPRSFGDPNSDPNSLGSGTNGPQIPMMTPMTPIPEPTGLKRYLKLPSWKGNN
jgi:hypothetical protein